MLTKFIYISKIHLNQSINYLSMKERKMYQLLINGRMNAGIKQTKNPNTFIYYSQTIDDVYVNLEDAINRRK